MALRAENLEVAGSGRRYLLAEPPDDPSVIVLSLHGSRSSPEGQARLSGMERFCVRGAVVVFPQGSWALGSGFEWDLDGDDRFLGLLVAHLVGRFPTADRRIVIAGMSGGARMASRFASLHSESVQVLGAVAGLRAPSAQVDHPLRVVAFHGTADRINPFAGGDTDRWRESVPDAASAWARGLGLSTESRRQRSKHLSEVYFDGGTPQAGVRLFVSEGAGHTWPGSRLPLLLRLFLGRTSREIDATEEIWTAQTSA